MSATPFNLAQFLLASGLFLLSMNHQLDPDPLCTTLSLSGQPVSNQMVHLSCPFFFSYKWAVRKIFISVSQEAVFHGLFSSAGYCPVGSCMPRDAAVASSQALGTLVTQVKMVGSSHVGQVFQCPRMKAVYVQRRSEPVCWQFLLPLHALDWEQFLHLKTEGKMY